MHDAFVDPIFVWTLFCLVVFLQQCETMAMMRSTSAFLCVAVYWCNLYIQGELNMCSR